MNPVEWLKSLLDWLNGETEPPPYRGGIIRIRKQEAERFWRLLCRVLTHRRRGEAVRMMAEKGYLASLMPELLRMKGVPQPERYHPEGDAFRHALLTLTSLKKPSCARAVAALLHDVGKTLTFSFRDRIRFNQHNAFGVPLIWSIAKRLRMPEPIKQLALFVCRKHMLLLDITRMRLPRLARLLKTPQFPDLLKIWEADIAASHGDTEALQFAKKVWEALNTVPLPKRWNHPLSVEEAKRAGLSHEEAVEVVRQVDLLALLGRIRTKKEALDFLQRHISKPDTDLKKPCL